MNGRTWRWERIRYRKMKWTEAEPLDDLKVRRVVRHYRRRHHVAFNCSETQFHGSRFRVRPIIYAIIRHYVHRPLRRKMSYIMIVITASINARRTKVGLIIRQNKQSVHVSSDSICYWEILKWTRDLTVHQKAPRYSISVSDHISRNH